MSSSASQKQRRFIYRVVAAHSSVLQEKLNQATLKEPSLTLVRLASIGDTGVVVAVLEKLEDAR